MRIKRIKGNIKRSSFDLEIDPEKAVVLIHGENGAGKTSIPIAINLALKGYEPSIAKSGSAQNNNTHRKLAGPEGILSSQVETDAGEFCYVLDHKGRSHRTPRDLADVELQLLDPSQFFDAGPKDRLDYILRVAEIKTSIEEVAESFPDSSVETPHKSGESVIPWLDHVMDAQRKEVKDLQSEIKRSETLAEELRLKLAEIPESRLPETALEDIDALNREHGELRGRVDTLKQELERFGEVQIEEIPSEPSQEEMNRAENEHEEIRAEYQALANEMRGIQREIHEIRHSLEETEWKECPTCRRPFDESSQNSAKETLKEKRRNLGERHLELLKKSGKLNLDLQSARARLDSFKKAEREFGAAKRRVERYEDDLKRKQEVQGKLSEALENLDRFEAQHDLEDARRKAELCRKRKQIQADLAEVEIGPLKGELETRMEIGKHAKKLKTQFMREALTDTLGVGAEAMARVLPWFNMEVDEKGNLGYFAGDTWVPYEAWSGAELAAAYAAMSISLAAKSAGLSLVIIDEFSRFSPPVQARLAEELGDLACEEVIDQAILLSPAPLESDGLELFQVIELPSRKIAVP